MAALGAGLVAVLCFGFLLIDALGATGTLFYTLDDPYIHLALAQRLRHGGGSNIETDHFRIRAPGGDRPNIVPGAAPRHQHPPVEGVLLQEIDEARARFPFVPRGLPGLVASLPIGWHAA